MQFSLRPCGGLFCRVPRVGRLDVQAPTCCATFCPATHGSMKPCSHLHWAGLPASGPPTCLHLPFVGTSRGCQPAVHTWGPLPVSNSAVRSLLPRCLAGSLPGGTEARQSGHKDYFLPSSVDFYSESSDRSLRRACWPLAPHRKDAQHLKMLVPMGTVPADLGRGAPMPFPRVCLSENGRKINHRPQSPR